MGRVGWSREEQMARQDEGTRGWGKGRGREDGRREGQKIREGWKGRGDKRSRKGQKRRWRER